MKNGMSQSTGPYVASGQTTYGTGFAPLPQPVPLVEAGKAEGVGELTAGRLTVGQELL